MLLEDSGLPFPRNSIGEPSDDPAEARAHDGSDDRGNPIAGQRDWSGARDCAARDTEPDMVGPLIQPTNRVATDVVSLSQALGVRDDRWVEAPEQRHRFQ